MNLEPNTDINFYQNLGKLFYAIAAVDKTVKDKEFSTLETIIRNDWFLEKNILKDFNQKKADTILNTFKWLQNDNEYSAEACYNSFINYNKAHKSLFNKDINSQILKTANHIAASFSKKNKSELIILAKLNLELNKQNDKT